MKKLLLAGLATGMTMLVSAIPLHASTIDFDNLQPFTNYDHLSGSYGSTADVTVSYQTLDQLFNPAYSYVELWNSGYGDLNTAAYAAYHGGILKITLTANDSSKSVLLNSFDVAAYPTSDITRLADVFEIIDGNGNVLVNYGSFYISGLVAQTLLPNVEAHSVSILLGYNWNNGVNNIDFDLGTSTPSPVPEPATMLLFGTGIASLAAVGRRKRS